MAHPLLGAIKLNMHINMNAPFSASLSSLCQGAYNMKSYQAEYEH